LFIHDIASYGRSVGTAAMDNDKNDEEVRQLAEVISELPVLLEALVMGFVSFRELVRVKELSEREAARHNEEVLNSFLPNIRHQ
jgi:hypothetical protein